MILLHIPEIHLFTIFIAVVNLAFLLIPFVFLCGCFCTKQIKQSKLLVSINAYSYKKIYVLQTAALLIKLKFTG